MSINAVNGVSGSTQQQIQSQATPSSPTVTPFSQQLDAETAKVHGHHHHGGGGSKSVTSSPAAAASASGGGTMGLLASSVLKLLH